MKFYYYFGATNYNCDAYGEGNYSTCDTNGASTSGPLANTGYDVIIPVALGAAVLVAGIVLLVRKFFKKK